MQVKQKPHLKTSQSMTHSLFSPSHDITYHITQLIFHQVMTSQITSHFLFFTWSWHHKSYHTSYFSHDHDITNHITHLIFHSVMIRSYIISNFKLLYFESSHYHPIRKLLFTTSRYEWKVNCHSPGDRTMSFFIKADAHVAPRLESSCSK